jgi:nickel-dependent lactate racemase
MKIDLAYGKTGLTIDLPGDQTSIIEPQFIPGLPDELGAIKTALRNPIGTSPLRKSIEPGQKVGISVCDITRPMPSKRILPVILNELKHIHPSDITIFIATGTHRKNTHSELFSMLGELPMSGGYNIVNHDAFSQANLTKVGVTKEHIPIFLNTDWIKTDFKITTGFVEPHFFAGFSGGPKMIAPGLAGFETIMKLHDSDMISNPNSKWGITHGNPIHDSIREIATLFPSDFTLDVTINKHHKITSVYAGEMFQVHKAACEFAHSTAMREVLEPFDIVVTTNSGYPLDMNLYQAVKGMSAAHQIVKKGGSIICAAECSDGIPDHGSYGEILKSQASPRSLLNMIETSGYQKHDQWQVQIQASIQMENDVYLKSGNLSTDQIIEAHFLPADDVSKKVSELLSEKYRNGTVCVLPEGPQTIPFLREVNRNIPYN